MRTFVMLIALALIPAAAAQSGPAAGYDSAVDYAADYADHKLQSAEEDPAEFVKAHASPEAAQNETVHAAYVACWAADDADVQAAACDAFYTPRGSAPPAQPEPEPCECQNASVPDAQAHANQTLNQTAEFASQMQEIANQTVQDPGNATSHLERAAEAVVGFVKAIVGGTVFLAVTVAEGALACIGAIGLAGQASGDALETFGGSVGDATQAAAGLLGEAGEKGTDGLVTGVSATGMFVADATQTMATQVADAALTAATGVTDAATFVVQQSFSSVQTGAQQTAEGVEAAGTAVADAATAVVDAVKSIFGGSNPSSDGPLGGKPPVDVDVDTDGLLDPVTGLLQ